MELYVDGGPFRLVRDRLHLVPGRDPGDRPVFGHAEHPGPGRVDQHHFVFFLARGSSAAVVSVGDGRERHGALDAAHRGRLVDGHGAALLPVVRLFVFTALFRLDRSRRVSISRRKTSTRKNELRLTISDELSRCCRASAASVYRGECIDNGTTMVGYGRWCVVRPNEPVAGRHRNRRPTSRRRRRSQLPRRLQTCGTAVPPHCRAVVLFHDRLRTAVIRTEKEIAIKKIARIMLFARSFGVGTGMEPTLG